MPWLGEGCLIGQRQSTDAIVAVDGGIGVTTLSQSFDLHGALKDAVMDDISRAIFWAKLRLSSLTLVAMRMARAE